VPPLLRRPNPGKNKTTIRLQQRSWPGLGADPNDRIQAGVPQVIGLASFGLADNANALTTPAAEALEQR